MVFLWNYLILSYAGFPFLMFQAVSSALWINVTDTSVIALTWLYSAVSLFLILIGVLFAKYILRVSNYARMFNNHLNNVYVSLSLIIILCFYIRDIITCIYTKYTISNIIRLARSSATNALDGA
jgi:hypothetical protein